MAPVWTDTDNEQKSPEEMWLNLSLKYWGWFTFSRRIPF